MRTGLLVLAATLLAACAGSPTRDIDHPDSGPAYDQRAEAVLGWPRWGFTARLSIDDGAEGGSGRLDWISNEAGELLKFRGALGQGAWQLSINQQGATLTLADGHVRHADTVTGLVEQEIGWSVPVDALGWWVRGLAMPGQESTIELNADGLPDQILQAGWSVNYSKYSPDDERLPTRLEANDDQVRVKLAVSRWWHEEYEEDEDRG